MLPHFTMQRLTDDRDGNPMWHITLIISNHEMTVTTEELLQYRLFRKAMREQCGFLWGIDPISPTVWRHIVNAGLWHAYRTGRR
jgi:hypothetical protein